ncbi:unnamed protein product [Protopolystoma xenopodis]|uniref:Uncharacterized protein n=1 Tax=Protopolystoma xenopodis TaxID=117903 RepID=A0A3S5B5M5_9PLAT|nr:unnamed protein product [Protopolystoma xenopodis]
MSLEFVLDRLLPRLVGLPSSQSEPSNTPSNILVDEPVPLKECLPQQSRIPYSRQFGISPDHPEPSCTECRPVTTREQLSLSSCSFPLPLSITSTQLGFQHHLTRPLIRALSLLGPRLPNILFNSSRPLGVGILPPSFSSISSTKTLDTTSCAAGINSTNLPNGCIGDRITPKIVGSVCNSLDVGFSSPHTLSRFEPGSGTRYKPRRRRAQQPRSNMASSPSEANATPNVAAIAFGDRIPINYSSQVPSADPTSFSSKKEVLTLQSKLWALDERRASYLSQVHFNDSLFLPVF